MPRIMAAVLSPFYSCIESFATLKCAPRDLYIVYIVKILESYTYFSLSLIYTIYLTDEFGVNDVDAGASYGIWGMLIVVWGMLLGPVIDYLGVRGSLLVSFSLSATLRAVLTTTTSLPLVYFVLYTGFPAAASLGVPVMTIGVKRYTSLANRTVAFGVFYGVQNVAALANGFLMDYLRITLCHGFGVKSLPADHWLNNGNRLIMAAGVVSSTLGFVLSLMLRSKELKDLDGTHTALSLEAEQDLLVTTGIPLQPQTSQAQDQPHSEPRKALFAPGFFQSIRELCNETVFRKYLILALVLTNLRQAFRYLDAVLPKYMERAFGCDVHAGSVYSINPAIIIVLVPIVSAMTTGIKHYDMLHYGSYLSALCPFWLFLLQSIAGSVLFVVTLSLGEAVWSPRWYEFTMMVAPEGREGVFTALATAPLFLAKLPTGIFSGYLLQTFCPANVNCSKQDSGSCVAPNGNFAAPAPAPAGHDPVPCRGQIMWMIVGFMTFVSPLTMSVFSGWLGSTEAEVARRDNPHLTDPEFDPIEQARDQEDSIELPSPTVFTPLTAANEA